MPATPPEPIHDCPVCRTPTPRQVLSQAGWAAPEVLRRLARQNPNWKQADGACPACVQQVLLQTLAEQGEAALHAGLQAAWPLDAEAVFGALPTPLRLHADPRFGGKGVTLALVDSAFYPHPDLTTPRNRIRAWVDAHAEHVRVLNFDPEAQPRWPGWDRAEAAQWHGLMTSATAAGNGQLSHGLYRGLAYESDVVLVQLRDAAGRIGNRAIARALNWLAEHGPELGVGVVNLSVGGDPVTPLAPNAVDKAVARLVGLGITVVAASGNDGVRRLVPPATAPLAITVGGLDDQNTFDEEAIGLWHSNYGVAATGARKPELVAPSIWVVAPLLPDTPLAVRAKYLFARRVALPDSASIEEQIGAEKLVTPFYQHVEGTSFAAPIVSSAIACMLEANPALTPAQVRELLMTAAQPIAGAPPERQGAGAVQAGSAVTLALSSLRGWPVAETRSPAVHPDGVTFQLHSLQATEVRLLGSWDSWQQPGTTLARIADGLWQGRLAKLAPGEYTYKFVLDGDHWLADPANAARSPDTYGGWNSVIVVPAAT